jgi:hypothetical protein
MTMKDNYRTGSDTLQDDPGQPSESGFLEISEDMAQALHRLLTPLWYIEGSYPMRLPSFVAARNALWGWFRAGRLRICREGDADVLGVVEKHRLLRVPGSDGVRFAMEADGKRYYADDEDLGTEEMASHLKWHYLLYRKPGEMGGADETQRESPGGKSQDAEENG